MTDPNPKVLHAIRSIDKLLDHLEGRPAPVVELDPDDDDLDLHDIPIFLADCPDMMATGFEDRDPNAGRFDSLPSPGSGSLSPEWRAALESNYEDISGREPSAWRDPIDDICNAD